VADLRFQVIAAEPALHAAAPLLHFRVRVTNPDAAEAVHNVLLRCQVRIEPARRVYGPEHHERLRELFGEPARWSQTLRSMLWANVSHVVPAFTGSVEIEMPVPCSFDFNVAATKYFYALEDDVVPLLFLFSGTVFFGGEEETLQVAQISWEREASFRLPVSRWREMMDHYYPNTAWLNLRRDVFDRLYRYKRDHSLLTWEQALERLFAAAEGEKP
jgi:hypothetical protein